MKRLIVLIAAAVVAMVGLAAPAEAAATDTVTIWVGLGSGHLYHGSYDACTGQFTASGSTTGATGTYAESVTGSYNKTTSQMTFTSVYGLDANGVIDDSTGTNNSAYAYTMSGAVTENWASGTYTVTKTPVGGVPQTSDPQAFGGQSVWFEVSDNGGACVPPPVVVGADVNHGQCVSAKTKAGLKGAALAVFAKQVDLVGADCHLAA